MIPETINQETMKEAMQFYNSLNRMLKRKLKKSINSGADMSKFMTPAQRKDKEGFDRFVAALKVIVNSRDGV